MPTDLLIHPSTRRVLDAYLKQPPHALLLVGPSGIGKRTLATHWAKAIGTEPQIVEPDEKGSISIATIRELYRAARSKREGQQVIIIDHAEKMSLEAENALLKLLEEPRPGVTFILCAPNTEALLPTITSRSQQITAQPLDQAALQQMAVKASLDAGDITQALFIARGRPATMARLLQDTAQFDQERDYMRQAKTLLSANQHERFVAISKLAANRETCISILEAMLQMISLQIKRTTDPTPWIHRASALEHTLTQLQNNGNIRAQLLRLFIASEK